MSCIRSFVRLVARSSNMDDVLESAASALLIALLACTVMSGQAPRGTVCVAPNSTERPRLISPGGDYNPATLSVKIDKGQLVLWPHKESIRISDLELNKRHFVTVVSDGKPIQSFWFRFSEYKSGELCLAFDGYQGVQLKERKRSPLVQVQVKAPHPPSVTSRRTYHSALAVVSK